MTAKKAPTPKLTARGAKLYDFCRDILGYYDLKPQPHHEICNFLGATATHLLEKTQAQEQRMLLVPRRLFKTSIGTGGLPLVLLTEFPNLRILLETHTHDYTKQQLARIKFTIERNQLFRQEYGDWNTNAPKWAEDSIITNKRTTSQQEGSIDTAAVDKPKTGGHYEVIICDDLHTEKNITSATQRARVKDHIENLMPILEPGGVIIILGTRWHAQDAYGALIKMDQEFARDGQPEDWKKLIRGCFLEDGQLYAPEHLTYAFLDRQRRKLTKKKFSAWYLNAPVSVTDKVFDLSTVQLYVGDYHYDYVPYIEARVEVADPYDEIVLV